MDEQRLAKLDPYLAGSLAARGLEPWDETTAEQEADKLSLTGERRDEFLKGWQEELAEQERERKGQMVREYDEMAKGYDKGDPAR